MVIDHEFGKDLIGKDNAENWQLARRDLRGHPYKVPPGSSHRRRRGSAFSVRVVKHWNKLPASVLTAPSVNAFKKSLEKVWTEVFPHLPH